MSTSEKPISIAEAIASGPTEPVAGIEAWHEAKVKERHRVADQGRFATTEAVKQVVRKFIPNG